MRVAILLLALATAPTAAQPSCPPCERGELVIDQFSLAAVRPLARELAALALGEPLTAAQYATIVELRRRNPTLGRLGALDDTELALVATALCRHPDDACTVATERALRCLADRCEVTLPPDPKADVLSPILECRRTPRKRSPPIGLSLDWGNGWDRSRYPNDGRTWSLGIAGRVQLSDKYGVVVRADRTAGRDEAGDLDRDGRDDMQTGTITRFSALAGPSIVLDAVGFEKSTRFLRLDLLAGYLATRTQPGEDGLGAGFDLSYQLGGFRMGARFVQGFAGAGSATTLLGHLGVAVGAVPPNRDDNDCARYPRKRESRLALGLELPLGGYGISEELGYMAIGFGAELLWYLSRRFDAVAHADILVFPGDDRERVIHQAVLGGFRIDHRPRRSRRRANTGFFSTVMAGYTHGATLTPNTTGTGPVLDLSLGWGWQDRDFGSHARLHGRFGLSGENEDYRAIFLSFGFELHFDPQHWRKRVRGNYY